jgi:hypothetical protein
MVFIALLGSLAEVDMLRLFVIVQGELNTVDILLEHTASVLTVYSAFWKYLDPFTFSPKFVLQLIT